MSDVTGSSVASSGTQPDNLAKDDFPAPSTSSGQAPVGQDRCVRCQADLTGDRRTARFCPRCGARRVDLAGDETPLVTASDLAPVAFSDHLIASEASDAAPPEAVPPPVPVLMPAAAQAAAWLQLSMAHPAAAGPGAAFGHRSNDDDVHSLMLLGYANALYRLGWRYETGLGSGRNPQEALRCYFKAAKLGNIAALSRLAPQCVASALPAAMNLQGNGVGAGGQSEPPPLSTPS